MIDSHTHLYADCFDADRAAVVDRALAAGVSHMILPCENLDSFSRILAMHEEWPDCTSLTAGLHPEEVVADNRSELAGLHKILATNHCVAVGEIGIDLYWDKTYRQQQMQVLEEQLGWCLEFDLPFIIHCRDGVDECIDVLKGFGARQPRGVFHSFTGSVADVERLRSIGDYYFGVNGIVTFKKSKVKELLPVVGLDRLLLETDSPYLAPVPHRGERNESSYVPLVCDYVAGVLGVAAEEVDYRTTQNVHTLFGI